MVSMASQLTAERLEEIWRVRISFNICKQRCKRREGERKHNSVPLCKYWHTLVEVYLSGLRDGAAPRFWFAASLPCASSWGVEQDFIQKEQGLNTYPVKDLYDLYINQSASVFSSNRQIHKLVFFLQFKNYEKTLRCVALSWKTWIRTGASP